MHKIKSFARAPKTHTAANSIKKKTPSRSDMAGETTSLSLFASSSAGVGRTINVCLDLLIFICSTRETQREKSLLISSGGVLREREC